MTCLVFIFMYLDPQHVLFCCILSIMPAVKPRCTFNYHEKLFLSADKHYLVGLVVWWMTYHWEVKYRDRRDQHNWNPCRYTVNNGSISSTSTWKLQVFLEVFLEWLLAVVVLTAWVFLTTTWRCGVPQTLFVEKYDHSTPIFSVILYWIGDLLRSRRV